VLANRQRQRCIWNPVVRLLYRRSVNGQRYFTTSGPMRGVFVRPERVVVGDYPEVDEFADMMDDSEDEI
jgi:hypothetical protein